MVLFLANSGAAFFANVTPFFNPLFDTSFPVTNIDCGKPKS